MSLIPMATLTSSSSSRTASVAPAPITVREGAAVDFSSLTLTGDVLYYADQAALVLIDDEYGTPERLSINLIDHGLVARPGHVFIKNWSEGDGVADSLVKAGVVEIVETHVVGPFGGTAYEVRVLVAE
jgi:hypothetical protein